MTQIIHLAATTLDPNVPSICLTHFRSVTKAAMVILGMDTTYQEKCKSRLVINAVNHPPITQTHDLQQQCYYYSSFVLNLPLVKVPVLGISSLKRVESYEIITGLKKDFTLCLEQHEAE